MQHHLPRHQTSSSISSFLSPHITVPNAWSYRERCRLRVRCLGCSLGPCERRFVHDASKPSCAVCLAGTTCQRGALVNGRRVEDRCLGAATWRGPHGVWMPYMQVFFKVTFILLTYYTCLFTYFILLLTCLHSVPSVHLVELEVVWCWIWWQVFSWKKQRILGVTVVLQS